ECRQYDEAPLTRGLDGELDGHGGAGALDAVDRDRAAVLLHHLARARQADAGPGDAPDHVAAAAEALEDARQVGRRDAQAAVAHLQHRPVPRGVAPHRLRDLAPLPAVPAPAAELVG